MHHTLPAFCLTALLTACATVAEPTTAPATQPATAPATQPANAAAANTVEGWLDRIEQRSADLQSLRAKLRYQRIQGLLGGEQVRFGELVYQAGPPARFAVHFDRLVVDERLQMQERGFIFDGRWMAERIVDDGSKVFIRRELVPPEEVGRDLLRLGEGPFALPLDLKKQTVLSRFDVSLADPAEDDPANTVHLALEPRRGTDIDQNRIDIWYDRDTLLPVQVRTEKTDADEVTVIRLLEPEPGAAVDADAFDTAPPREPDWQVEIKPLSASPT